MNDAKQGLCVCVACVGAEVAQRLQYEPREAGLRRLRVELAACPGEGGVTGVMVVTTEDNNSAAVRGAEGEGSRLQSGAVSYLIAPIQNDTHARSAGRRRKQKPTTGRQSDSPPPQMNNLQRTRRSAGR